MQCDITEASQGPEFPARTERQQPEEKEAEVDDFLAMFADGDNDIGDEDEGDDNGNKISEPSKEPPLMLDPRGEPDTALTYGIQFIQNALKSWATQRLSAQYAQHVQQLAQLKRMKSQPPRRGPGRPRKFEHSSAQQELPPSIIEMPLSSTPEGAAIAAFQEVLDSGCLQVNARLPVPLTRALRHLYMQIDQLINQGSRNEGEWQCMSYNAQIKANQIRVQKWKDAQVKAQAEMARQQQLAQQQMMHQMGIPPHQQHRGRMTTEQMQQAHAIDLERRRDLQQAAQQPHLTQYLTSPMLLNPQLPGTPNSFVPSPSSANGPSAGSPPANAPNGDSPKEQSTVLPNPLNILNTGGGKPYTFDKVKLYTPGFLPRSGQSMKFSFAPHSELAVQTFGAQAFPPGNHGPNLPNRGPMSKSPLEQSMVVNTPNVPRSDGQRPGSGSSGQALSTASAAVSAENAKFMNDGANKPESPISDTIHVATHRAATPKEGSKSKKQSDKDATTAATSPIATANGTHKSTAAATSASPAIGSKVSKPGAHGDSSDMASRFPHPGAIVLDQ